MPVTAICIRPSSATAATRKSSRAWNGLWTTSSTPRWSLAARCPAEHGIGTAKIKWLEQETSHGTIMFSRRLRKAFDPKGLFNPSKIVGFGD